MAYMENGITEALDMLAAMPPAGELSMAGIDDPIPWLGMGYCVARGWAVYRGSYCFQITEAGRLARQERNEPSEDTVRRQRDQEWR